MKTIPCHKKQTIRESALLKSGVKRLSVVQNTKLWPKCEALHSFMWKTKRYNSKALWGLLQVSWTKKAFQNTRQGCACEMEPVFLLHIIHTGTERHRFHLTGCCSSVWHPQIIPAKADIRIPGGDSSQYSSHFRSSFKIFFFLMAESGGRRLREKIRKLFVGTEVLKIFDLFTGWVWRAAKIVTGLKSRKKS